MGSATVVGLSAASEPELFLCKDASLSLASTRGHCETLLKSLRVPVLMTSATYPSQPYCLCSLTGVPHCGGGYGQQWQSQRPGLASVGRTAAS